ncbi:hypothetical protein BDN70DRAFT_984994 [Pholiota conissans]|uniref:Uncharacterized protein n=1 Tax=Pholiota conissans TaxID=109636 RepID=A0A9P5Z0H0_9AGAR|nr:hypothetical protein BDN70DRAFT_984994 [Pholiota conissans]
MQVYPLALQRSKKIASRTEDFGLQLMIHPLALVKELVRRSNTSLLDIVYCKRVNSPRYHQSFKSEVWQHAFKNAPLWGSFSFKAAIISHGGSNFDALSEGLKRPTPKLEAFTLHDTSQPSLLPYLQHVCEEDIMRNVTRNWFDILRPLKQLRLLELSHIFCQPTAESRYEFANIANIHLDHLSVLDFKTSFAREIMIDLFAKIVVPSTCHISLQVLQCGCNEYPTFAFDRLKLGLDRHVRRLLLDNSDDSLAIDINTFQGGTGFRVGIWLAFICGQDSEWWERGTPNFEFSQISEVDMNGLDVDSLTPPRVRSTPPPTPPLWTMDTLTHARSPHYSFAHLLEAMEDVPVSKLYIEWWSRMVVEDVDPLRRFLSRCESADYVDMRHTDMVILDVLQNLTQGQGEGRGILLPNVREFRFMYAHKDDIPRVEEFRAWRAAIGMLPGVFEYISD